MQANSRLGAFERMWDITLRTVDVKEQQFTKGVQLVLHRIRMMAGSFLGLALNMGSVPWEEAEAGQNLNCSKGGSD